MTPAPASVVAHTTGLCPVCSQPYGPADQAVTDVEAVDHLGSHGPREVAFALLVADARRVLAEGAADFTRSRVAQVTAHLGHVADEQRTAVTGGPGF